MGEADSPVLRWRRIAAGRYTAGRWLLIGERGNWTIYDSDDRCRNSFETMREALTYAERHASTPDTPDPAVVS